MKRLLMIAVLPVFAGLAACHGKQADGNKSAAAAEVLPGSASDAMIAYDTLKSQPPLAAPTDDRGDNGTPHTGSHGRDPEDAFTAPSDPAPIADHSIAPNPAPVR